MLTAEKDLFELPRKEIQTYRMGCHDGSEDSVPIKPDDLW